MSKREPRDPTAQEIAAMTGLGYRQVWKAAREGRIPVTIEGRRMSMTDGQRERLNREGVKPKPKNPKPDKNPFLKSVA